MKKIKVAFFADCLIENYDGAIRTMYQLIDRIDTYRFEYLFITGDAPQGDFDHEVLEVPSIQLPINRNYKMSLPFVVEGKINQKLMDFGPDLIHIATPSPLGHFGLQYARQMDLPSLTIYHTHYLSYVDYYLQHIKFLLKPAKNLLIAKLRSFYNQCDAVYVPTERMKNSLREIGVFTSHMHIWKRGIDTNTFSVHKRDEEYFQKITQNEKSNLLFASRLVREKNLATLVKIYQRIEEQNLSYNLIIAGSGYAEEELRTQMPKAYFLGNLPQNELAIVYASADVFVFPSVSETYGNVVAEAMVSGLPCVIANGGGTVEFIDQGENGFLCRPNDPSDYLDKVDVILSDEALRSKFRMMGIEQMKHLSWDSLAQEYFDEIERLLQESYAIRA